jgi:3-dehydroquinate synthase
MVTSGPSPLRRYVASARRLERYPILVQPGLSARLARVLDDLGLERRLVVSSPRIWRLHGGRFGALTRHPLLVPDGEPAKTPRTVARLHTAFVARGVDRATAIVAVGGGVVGDMTGFAAATFLRGVPLVHVPTTVVAQVDAAIGGKVGVNLPAGKNLLGAFAPPRAVIVDPDLLGTLPRREFVAGLYEVVKYGIVCSAPLLDRLSRLDLPALQRDLPALVPIVSACCRLKARLVTLDERDAGPRLVLNFGHTVGHALETATAYGHLRHGEAVGWGMLVALEISARRGLIGRGLAERLAALVHGLGRLPEIGGVRFADLLAAMRRDKKRVGRRLTFVLCAGPGRAVVVDDVTARDVRAALESVCAAQPP